jgi:hypothetical protein
MVSHIFASSAQKTHVCAMGCVAACADVVIVSPVSVKPTMCCGRLLGL